MDMDFQAAFKYNTGDIADRYNLTANQVKRLYYQNETVSHNNMEKFVDFTTDFYFVEGIQKFARVQAEESSAPTYLYQFSYDPPESFSKRLIKSDVSGK